MPSVLYHNEIIEYSFSRKQVKKINLRIRADGSVSVSAPRSVPFSAVENFVLSNAAKILSARRSILANENKKIRFENGDPVCILGRTYFLTVFPAEKDHYTIDGNNILFYLSDLSYERKAAIYDRVLSDVAKRVFPQIVKDCLPLFSQQISAPPLLKIRKMKSQWGNCRAQKNIVTLNSRLAAYNREIIRFVVCHELCHFIRQDHSKAFYAALSSVLPNWKEYDAVLKNK